MTRLSLGSLLSERLAKNRALTQVQAAVAVTINETIAEENTAIQAVQPTVVPEAQQPAEISTEQTIIAQDTGNLTIGEASESVVASLLVDDVAADAIFIGEDIPIHH